MLHRQKALLALLERLDRPVGLTTFVKLAFLAREETTMAKNHAYYDFVPYRYGPFSFALYRELRMLERDGYIDVAARSVELRDSTRQLALDKANELPTATLAAISEVVARYGSVSRDELLRDVYLRYPWYASKTHSERHLAAPLIPGKPVEIAIYTIGYEGKSIDRFFDLLLRRGINTLIDVRANPVSRRYGFSRGSLRDIGTAVDIVYRHIPELGIPSLNRKVLANGGSRKLLLDEYQRCRLPEAVDHVEEASSILVDRPSVLLCLEANPEDCHRGRLANELAKLTGLAIIHL